MKNIITLLALMIICEAKSGDPARLTISPDPILNTDSISIGVDPFYSPCLIFADNVDGERFDVQIVGNQITLTFVSIFFNPCPGTGGGPIESFNIGSFPEGSYDITVNTVGPNISFPLTGGENPIQIGLPISINVLGSAQAVPATSNFLIVLLAIIIIYTIKRKMNVLNKKFAILFFVLCFSSFSYAKTFHVLLDVGPGVPTVESVVLQAQTSPAPPGYLLQSFNDAPPINVDFLIQNRPTGRLLELIESAPDWSRSRLHRYLLVTYSDSIDEINILNNFTNDAFVIHAGFIGDLDGVISSGYTNKSSEPTIQGDVQIDLGIANAWELSEGMGYIGALDLGLQIDHPDLRAFDDLNNYTGGNLLDGFYQIDFAGGDLNVDENEPFDTGGVPSFELCDLADGVNDNLATSYVIGHGTHISGLLAASNGNGICKNCGLSMMKWGDNSFCSTNLDPGPTMFPIVSPAAVVNGMNVQASVGIGVVNWSGGFTNPTGSFCPDVYGLCDALDFMKEQNVLMVGAAGNSRAKMQFPASEVNTVAVGGLDELGEYWNESPNNGNPLDFSNESGCPPSRPNGEECGSNYSHTPLNQKLDVMTQAKNVYSTFYEGGRYAFDLGCEDSADGIPNDGYGICTGTSVSSPQVAAILQLMRSAIPLFPNGTYNPSEDLGLINVLNSTSSRTQNGLSQSDFFGYGFPDARLALEKLLGVSNNEIMMTRLTPMFSLRSDILKNNVYTPFPQVAAAYLMDDVGFYLSDAAAPLVTEFPDFWYDTNSISLSAPRAAFYVFTTNNNPFVNLKNMVPLRRMEKSIADNRNDTYAISSSEIESFKADGYNYAGIEGYIFPTCLTEPGCIPANMQKLYRVEDDINFNHTLVNLPVNDPAPANSTKLGYVFPNIDTDGDGLIDGQERILGTSISLQDTDGDTIPDGVEYPAAGVPFSDPLISDIIFEDGFE